MTVDAHEDHQPRWMATTALQAARTGLAQRAAALDRAQDDADARERAADQRQRTAGQDD